VHPAVERWYIASVSTVLVVQPDPLLNEEWCQTLAVRGHEVLAVSGVIDGIQRAREGGIDVVVVDSYDTSGAVSELVAELDRLPDAPPLILVSSSPHAPELSAHIGAAAFEPEDLADEVQRVATVRVRRLVHIDDEPTGRHDG
jgi:DNA-binding NtrC family response regulator